MSTTIDQRVLDEAVYAYIDWRELSRAVQDADDRWTRAPRSQAAAAFRAYTIAVDHEERSSFEYALLVGSVVR